MYVRFLRRRINCNEAHFQILLTENWLVVVFWLVEKNYFNSALSNLVFSMLQMQAAMGRRRFRVIARKKQTTIASFDKILLQRSQGSETGLSLLFLLTTFAVRIWVNLQA